MRDWLTPLHFAFARAESKALMLDLRQACERFSADLQRIGVHIIIKQPGVLRSIPSSLRRMAPHLRPPPLPLPAPASDPDPDRAGFAPADHSPASGAAVSGPCARWLSSWRWAERPAGWPCKLWPP